MAGEKRRAVTGYCIEPQLEEKFNAAGARFLRVTIENQ